MHVFCLGIIKLIMNKKGVIVHSQDTNFEILSEDGSELSQFYYGAVSCQQRGTEVGT
jgi:hypothetical protein